MKVKCSLLRSDVATLGKLRFTLPHQPFFSSWIRTLSLNWFTINYRRDSDLSISCFARDAFEFLPISTAGEKAIKSQITFTIIAEWKKPIKLDNDHKNTLQNIYTFSQKSTTNWTWKFHSKRFFASCSQTVEQERDGCDFKSFFTLKWHAGGLLCNFTPWYMFAEKWRSHSK